MNFPQVILWILAGIGGLVAACILLLLLYFLLIMISSVFMSDTKFYDKEDPYCRWIINSAMCLLDFFIGVHVHVTGAEKIPENTRFLFVQNHRSNFDPMISWYVFRKHHISFISKPENFKIPWFGRVIRRCCFLAIDRENPKNATKTLSDATNLLKNDVVSVGIYPEGTRGDGSALREFHNGTFYIARNAAAPIVVSTVMGTEKIHKNYFRRRTDVYIDVVDVIPAEEVVKLNTRQIGERIRSAMEANLIPVEVESAKTASISERPDTEAIRSKGSEE